MSYIKKIESDYDKNIISLKEVSVLREKYNSLYKTHKLELDKKIENGEEVIMSDELLRVEEFKIGDELLRVEESKMREESKCLNRIEGNVETIKNILIFFVILSVLYIIITILSILNM